MSQIDLTSPVSWPADELTARYEADYQADIRPYLQSDEICLERDVESGILKFQGCAPGDGPFYERIAEHTYYYLDDKWEFGEALRFIAELERDLQRSPRILEIGCGNGAFLKQCKDAGHEHCEGLEINAQALDDCLNAGLDVTNKSLEECAHAGEKYDFICAFQVLEHVPDPISFLKSIQSLLSDRGQMVLSTPNAAAFTKNFHWNLLDLPPHHMSRWDEVSYQQTAQLLGLRLVETSFEPLAKYHYKFYVSSKLQQYKHKSMKRRLAKIGATIAFKLNPLKKAIRGHSILVRMSADAATQIMPREVGAEPPNQSSSHAATRLHAGHHRTSEPKDLRLLNVGCGRCYHDDWTNIDLESAGPGVRQYDLRRGLPYEDNSFDGVYHSHVLEHIEPANAASMIAECCRVLRPGGVLRVVVPDLEGIAKAYLETLTAAADCLGNASGDQLPDSEREQRFANHHWMTLEAVDQLTRHRGGGEMGRLMRSPNVVNLDFIQARMGQQMTGNANRAKPKKTIGQRIQRALRGLRKQFALTAVTLIEGSRGRAAYREGRFRQSGEVHRWMYDRVSLSKLLSENGFTEAIVCGAAESSIAGFDDFQLDRDGSQARKPDSLYVEATKRVDQSAVGKSSAEFGFSSKAA